MENRRPGPEDTENSTSTKSNKAESVAVWLRRQRDDEQHILLAKSAEKDDEEEDEDDSEGVTNKKVNHLKLGSLTVQGKDTKVTTEPKGSESDVHVSKIEEDDLGGDEEYDAVAEQDALDASHMHDVEVGSDSPTDAPESQDDFEQWEQQLVSDRAEVGSADMQMGEEDDKDVEEDQSQSRIPRQRTNSSSSKHHQPRTNPATAISASSRSSLRAAVSQPPVGVAGGGGNVPPINNGGNTPGNPNNPNGPFGSNPNAQPVFSSPNIVSGPPNANVLLNTNPNKVDDHEHRHGHPRLAAAMLVGLLVEHGLRKRADRKIQHEMRTEDNKLRQQIERNQASQNQARRSLEAQQMQLEAEQGRQRQVLEYTRPVVNAERVMATGRAESVRQTRSDEAQQSLEETSVLSMDVQVEARARQRTVMEQVAAAAENDSPVERAYERRQEVKDEPSTPAAAAAGGAASVGSAPANNPVHFGTGQSTPMDPYRQDVRSKRVQANGADYRAAAIRGVGAAGAVIAFALLAYLLL